MRAPILIILLIFVSTLSRCKATKKKHQIPPFVKICHRSDPNLNDCFISSFNSLRPHLADGIPELLIPPFEPLLLPMAQFKDNSFKATFENLEVDYMNELELDSININLDKVKVDLSLTIPKLRIRSNYNMTGRILVLSLDGYGNADGNFTDIVAKVGLSGVRIKDGGEKLYFEDVKLWLEVGDAEVYFDGLFEDEELTDATNRIINENIKDIIEELMPLIRASVGEFVFKLVRNIFRTFTIDDLLPL